MAGIDHLGGSRFEQPFAGSVVVGDRDGRRAEPDCHLYRRETDAGGRCRDENDVIRPQVPDVDQRAVCGEVGHPGRSGGYRITVRGPAHQRVGR